MGGEMRWEEKGRDSGSNGWMERQGRRWGGERVKERRIEEETRAASEEIWEGRREAMEKEAFVWWEGGRPMTRSPSTAAQQSLLLFSFPPPPPLLTILSQQPSLTIAARHSLPKGSAVAATPQH
ncbi:hypothetical protein niasHS_003326 [Heterodera schachtii]|uniref:Uncharacterized protein n=1 Tax=Heterodera schachtii TaxID=97005 RepID=A0ABD2KG68_HETSC